MLAVKLIVSRSDVAFEAVYPRPEFGLFRDDAGLLARLVARLSPHGLKLTDMKIERGSGNLGEVCLLFTLVDYLLTVRVRLDQTNIFCSLLTEQNKKRVIAATVDTLDCIRQHIGGEYRAYTVTMNIHGLLEHQSANALLSRLIVAAPPNLGPVTGGAVAYYLSSHEDRTAASLTCDISQLTVDGLYARPHTTWDATRLPLEQLAERAEEFVRRALGSFDIEMP